MLLFILAYLGGVLTILSPCILPVLPFVFARADKPFVESGLPMLVGMAATFALVATLAAVGGGWAVTANEYGRYTALVLLAVFGVALIFPAVSERLTRPLVSLGDRLSQNTLAGGGRSSVLPSLLLGVATGLLWAPCAGPILGLILTGAAIQGASAGTTILLLAYAAGAATLLALALLVGGRAFAAIEGLARRRRMGAAWPRRGRDLRGSGQCRAGVRNMSTSFCSSDAGDTGVLTRVAAATTAPRPLAPPSPWAARLEGKLPPLTGATAWLNSPPLTPEALKGKVVVVDF
jgi:cytochrome c biogenesis protein CcdA